MAPVKFRLPKISFGLGNKTGMNRNGGTHSFHEKRLNPLLVIFDSIGGILRYFKIQTRLIASFLILTIIPLTIIGVSAYSQSSQAIQDNINTYSVQVLSQVSKNIKIEMTKVDNYSTEVAFFDMIQKSLTNMDRLDDSEKFTIFNDVKKFLSSKFTALDWITSVGVYSGTESIFTYGTSITLSELSRLNEIAEKNKGVGEWSTASTSSNAKAPVYVRAINSMVTSQQVATLVIATKPGFFNDIYKSVNFGVNAEMFILNEQGILVSSNDPKAEVSIAYKDTTLIPRVLETEKQNVGKDAAKKIFTFQKELNGEQRLVVYSPIEKTGMYLIGTIPMSYLNAKPNAIMASIVKTGVLFLLLALLLSSIIARSISGPSKKLVGLMKEAKSGNLALMVRDRSRDEIAQVNNNFGDMLSNINNLVSQVRASAQNVLDNSEKIASSADRSYTVSEQVAVTIQQIAKGASDQAAGISEGVHHLNSLSDGINKVDNDMGKVAEVVSGTKKLSEDAFATVKLLNDKALETTSVSEKIANEIVDLHRDMKEIKKIVKVIVGIADQTNLLSLNAAIEAARAGEAGKGFAVVADEVKKLADQSKEASITINNIITSIQQKTEHTVTVATSANAIVKQQMGAVVETDNAFKTIYKAMESIISNINNMSTSVRDMMASKDKSVEIIEGIAAVSEEAAATSEEVSASTEEQMAGAEELSNFAKSLNEMAQELGSAISTFKTE
jgi:methyl-accepting chemotaxis protein